METSGNALENLVLVPLTLDIETQGKILAKEQIASEKMFTIVCSSCNADLSFDSVKTEPVPLEEAFSFEYYIKSIDGSETKPITLHVNWRIVGTSHRCWIDLDNGEMVL